MVESLPGMHEVLRFLAEHVGKKKDRPQKSVSYRKKNKISCVSGLPDGAYRALQCA